MVRPSCPRVSVVVPARNEGRNLEIVLPLLDPEHEIVLVDGSSIDDTIAVTRRLRPDAVIVQQTRKGKGNALACGFAAATGDVIVMFDADGSADPAEIPGFVAALTAGADVAKGTRFTAGAGSEDITVLRRSGNAGLNGLANVLLRSSYSDLCYGYNAFWADMIDVLDLPAIDLPAPAEGLLWGDGFEIETLLTCRFAAVGARVTEVASVERERIHGETNLRTFADGFRVLRTLAREWVRPAPARVPARAVAVVEPVAVTAPREAVEVTDVIDMVPAPRPVRPVRTRLPLRSVLPTRAAAGLSVTRVATPTAFAVTGPRGRRLAQ